VTKPPVYKVVIAGDENVGKTSLVRRYCEGKFDASRVATIGVDFQTQTVELEQGPVKLSIWDMAGQERFKPIREGFYRGSLAAALVYDVTVAESLAHLERWYHEVTEAAPNQGFVVVGNKIDLERADIVAHARALAEALNAPFVETSALTGEGVEQMFHSLAQQAYARGTSG
jgi:Ras-related protein Rab-1A